MTKFEKRIISTFIVLTIVASVLYYLHYDFYKIPEGRISLNESYSEMPEDSLHHYINFPIDHNDISKGFFKGFYLFSPQFYKSKNITFLLTDGQMELVSTETDFDFFENVLRENSYVLIGVRGHSPTFFREAYKNGKVDYAMAEKLFNSDQQIEDIEMVRLDLIKKGILGKDNKINIFGASGAGVLAQQYISKYGATVSRVILESTGAPDLAIQYGLKYSPDFKDYNHDGAKFLDEVLTKKASDKQFICNLLYQTGRTNKNPKEAQIKILNKLKNGGSLLSYKFKPTTNLAILNYMVSAPKEISARVRWFELVGNDLLKYDSKVETNLLYELSEKAVSDLLQYHKTNKVPAKSFSINRNNFKGEVLILKGTEDVVFSDEINRKIQEAYPNARLLFFKDGHRMQNDIEKYIQIRSIFLNYGFDSDEYKKVTN